MIFLKTKHLRDHQIHCHSPSPLCLLFQNEKMLQKLCSIKTSTFGRTSNPVHCPRTHSSRHSEGRRDRTCSDTSESGCWRDSTWGGGGERRERGVDHWGDHSPSLGGYDSRRCDRSHDSLGRSSVEGTRHWLSGVMSLGFMGL